MSQYDSDKVFDALAIRDTSNHNSVVSDNRGFTPKTIAVCNKLNQTVSFQLQGCFDNTFTEVFNIGSSWDITASTNGYQNTETYFPFFRLVASCSASPTTGTLTVFMLKVEG